jgi:diguanylate cyclase (GGDEF)-like protein/PAS domain S-box-containing protein
VADDNVFEGRSNYRGNLSTTFTKEEKPTMGAYKVTDTLLALALENVSEGSLITDANRNTIYSNAAFTKITGYKQSQMLGYNCRVLQGPDTSLAELERMRAALAAGEVFNGTILNYRKDGTSFWNQLTISPIHDAKGVVTHFVSVQRDVTDAIEERKKLSFAASHDQLTGLPNRAALADHLQRQFAEAASEGSVIAVCILDLDDFKAVNDQHGHLSGDQLLRDFSSRLAKTLRRGDYIARLGGDEFVVVLSGLRAADPGVQLGHLLERIHAAVDAPFEAQDGVGVFVGMSMGVALFPEAGLDGNDILRAADSALYQVKDAKNRTRWWEVARPRNAM